MLKKLALFLLNIYQSTKLSRQPVCRFVPSCSEYSREAIERHGLIKGGVLTLTRLCKCHPLCSSYGFDPVPSQDELACHNSENEPDGSFLRFQP